MENLEKQILREVWKAHYNLVGDEAIDKLKQAINSGLSTDEFIKSAQGGGSFDYESSLKVLAEGLKIVGAVLAIYVQYKAIKGHNPTEDELKEKVLEEKIADKTSNPVVSQKIEKVIETIIKKQ